MSRLNAWALASVAVATLVTSGCRTVEITEEVSAPGLVHYVEIVSGDVDAQCAVLEQLHGLSFAEPNPVFGGARVAEAPDGSLVGVRGPLAEHEAPIVRTYLQVEDVKAAAEQAAAGGAMVAYPPTTQGDTGTWAIYILGDAQVGLWQP